MVKPGKDLGEQSKHANCIAFDGGSFHPHSAANIVRNDETGAECRLPPTRAGILKTLLERPNLPVALSTFRSEYWSNTIDEHSFLASLKTHLCSLRKDLRSVGLAAEVINRSGATIEIKADVRPYQTQPNHGASIKEVGLKPRGATDTFLNRQAEMRRLSELLALTPHIKAVNIFGRFGVGKTALACQVMLKLLKAQTVDGLVYLSPDTSFGINIDQIYGHCARIIGGAEEERLKEIWGNVQIPSKHKIQVLIEELQNRRIIILLDGLESMMNQGNLIDSDVYDFLESFLATSRRARLLITSNEPLYPARVESRRFLNHYPLEEGLPRDDALKFFVSLDSDGAAHLASIPSTLLAEIFNKTRGIPRALTYVAHILATKPTLDLRDLLEKEQLFHSEVIEQLGNEAHASLSEYELRVMQALSIFKRPVTEAAVVFLLHGHMQDQLVRSTLDRLALGKYINVTYKGGERRFAAQQWDSALSYRKIPEKNGGYTRRILHLRAAEYYRRARPHVSDWKDLTTLQPVLDEIDQLIRGEDYDKAYAEIALIDANYLSAWGHYHHVIKLREALRNKFSDVREAINLRCLSNAYLNAGQYDYAYALARQSREAAQNFKNQSEEAVALLYVGLSLHNLGQYRVAEVHYQTGVALARAAKNEVLEGTILGRLAALYRNLALHLKACQYEEDALAIATHTQNGVAQCNALRGMGTLLSEMGQFREALRFHSEALRTARKSNLRKSEGICLAQIGVTWRDVGRYDVAMEAFAQSLSIATDLQDNVTKMKALGGMGKVLSLQGHHNSALDNFTRAVEIAAELNMEGPQQHWGTCLAQTYLHEQQLDEAFEAIRKPLSQDTPWNTYRVALVNGIILLKRSTAGRKANEQVRRAFKKVRVISDQLLTTTPRYHAAQYTRCVASFGLALITTGKESKNFLTQARAYLKQALLDCATAGVCADYLKLLSELTIVDRNGILESALQQLRSPASFDYTDDLFFMG